MFCVIVAINVAAQATILWITDAKLYFLLVSLSTQDNAKPLEQLKSGSRKTINWDIHQAKVSMNQNNKSVSRFLKGTLQRNLEHFLKNFI